MTKCHFKMAGDKMPSVKMSNDKMQISKRQLQNTYWRGFWI